MLCKRKKKENELVTGLIPYLKIITKNIIQLGNLTELCINCAGFYLFVAMDNFILQSFYFLNSIICLKNNSNSNILYTVGLKIK